MKSYQQQNLATMQKELSALQSAMNSAVSNKYIAQGSEAWADMKKEIESVEDAILDSKKAIADYNKQIQQINWDFFDKTQEYMERVQTQNDFLLNILETQGEAVDEETGWFTNNGLAQVGLHATNYNAYLAQAQDYKDEITKINKQLAEDPYNTTLIDRKNDLVDSYQDAIKAAQDQKDSIKGLYQDAYDSLLDRINSIIDKRKQLLDTQSDLFDYEQDVQEQTKEIASLQKQLLALSGDDSQETKAKLQTLSSDLEDAQKELNQTQYDKWKSDQQQMLDNLYDEWEQLINTRLDDINLLLQQAIDTTNSNAETIGATITSVASETGATITEYMKSIWFNNGNGNVVSLFSQKFETTATSTKNTLDSIKNYCSSILNASNSLANQNVKSAQTISNTTPSKAATSASTTKQSAMQSATSAKGSFFVYSKNYYSKGSLSIDTSIVDRLKYHDYASDFGNRRNYYQAMGLGSASSYTGSASQNAAMISWMKNNGFSKGGTIGQAIKLSGEDGFVLARSGEQILSLDKIEAMKDVFTSLDPLTALVGKNILGQITNNTSSPISVDTTMNVTFELPNVSNYDDFINTAKSDKRFERIVQQMTLGNALGKNTLSKYKY